MKRKETIYNRKKQSKYIFVYASTKQTLIWTEVPAAFPMRFVSLKPMVTAKHNSINVQLISGL